MVDENKCENETTEKKHIVGEPTAALTMKQRYHKTHFKRVKKLWVRNPGAPSLKQFARQLLASGDPIAKDWFAHKHGLLNKPRTNANIKAAREAAAATKASRRKAKGGK
jgi:hypothetical protein